MQYVKCNASNHTASLSHIQSIVQQLLASFQSSSMDFGLLFWFECCLISAPTFDCHSALCWKSIDCNHFTCSLKSQHKPWFIIHRAERAIQDAVNNCLSGHSCFKCGHFERRLQIWRKLDRNINLCFSSALFHQVPIKAYFLMLEMAAVCFVL